MQEGISEKMECEGTVGTACTLRIGEQEPVTIVLGLSAWQPAFAILVTT